MREILQHHHTFCVVWFHNGSQFHASLVSNFCVLEPKSLHHQAAMDVVPCNLRRARPAGNRWWWYLFLADPKCSTGEANLPFCRKFRRFNTVFLLEFWNPEIWCVFGDDFYGSLKRLLVHDMGYFGIFWVLLQIILVCTTSTNGNGMDNCQIFPGNYHRNNGFSGCYVWLSRQVLPKFVNPKLSFTAKGLMKENAVAGRIDGTMVYLPIHLAKLYYFAHLDLPETRGPISLPRLPSEVRSCFGNFTRSNGIANWIETLKNLDSMCPLNLVGGWTNWKRYFCHIGSPQVWAVYDTNSSHHVNAWLFQMMIPLGAQPIFRSELSYFWGGAHEVGPDSSTSYK